MNAMSQILVFDRALVRLRRDRAATKLAHYSALLEEGATYLLERLDDVTRSFPNILDLGCHAGALTRQLAARQNTFVVGADLSEKMVLQAPAPSLVADEEFLPFAANSFDCVISNLSLHWVNDLPGSLAQIKNILKPNGLFLASILGGQTLHEFRSCLLDAELSVTGGISPRLSPTVDLLTASGLLQRAGFALPVADQEVITLTYRDAFALMRDLRGMGETNAHDHRLRTPTRRSLFMEAAKLYEARFARPDGTIPATFDMLFLHGWKPAV